MGGRITLLTLMLTLSPLTATSSDAFVGTIAVGLGPMNEVGEVKTSFSADARVETEEGTINSRLYYRPGMVRDEMEMGGQKMVSIRRMDLQKVWMIMVGQGMYMESVPGQPTEQAPEYRLVSRDVIGPETVNGMAATKYKSVYESEEGRFTGFTWYTEDHIAVKAVLVSESRGEKQRVAYELSNVKRDAQPASLFEVPAGYRRFDMGAIPRTRGISQPSVTRRDASPGATPGEEGAQPEESFGRDMAEGAERTAKDSVQQETNKAIRDSIKKGMKGLFGR